MKKALAALGFVGLFGLLGAFALSCNSNRRGTGPGGKGDGGIHDMSMSTSNLPDLATPDPGMCTDGKTIASCANPLAVDEGCGPTELCGTGTGNGLDDNCNGTVDEGCGCTPGDVQKCFLGPPGKHNVGACTDGMQTCSGGEFGVWGDCKGSISPTVESCDGTDNDCNGCSDERICCDATLACPGMVPDVEPYTDVAYKGADYFHGTATSWSWTVTGGPCDQLFATTTGTPPSQSFTVTGGDTANPSIHFTLSGDYTITMTVQSGGQTLTCTWVQHVAGPGVRFELCWDKTGFSGADLDLHLHKPNSTTNFFNSSGTTVSNDDCNYRNCKADPESGLTRPSWGYATSPIAACSGGPEGASWTSNGSCANPRLDIDNISTSGVPENINVDKPANGDTFRALVHFYGINGGGPSLTVHPLVNIYCGGRLKTTYGQAPDFVTGFAKPGAWSDGTNIPKGDMWRVADVAAIVDATGTTTDCTVTALHPAGTTTGYVVGHDAKISYDGL